MQSDATMQYRNGKRAFGVAATNAWNNLPVDVQASDSLKVFKKDSKLVCSPINMTADTVHRRRLWILPQYDALQM